MALSLAPMRIAFLLVVVTGALIGVLIPHGSAPPVTSAPSAAAAPPRETVIERSERGHFAAVAEVNGMPVRFIVETQFILTEYLEMRKLSHIWYKIFRADSATDLLADFKKYAIAYEESESELFEAYVNSLRGDASAYKKYAIGRRQTSTVGELVDNPPLWCRRVRSRDGKDVPGRREGADKREDPSTSHRRRHRRRGRRRDVFNFTNVPRAVH